MLLVALLFAAKLTVKSGFLCCKKRQKGVLEAVRRNVGGR